MIKSNRTKVYNGKYTDKGGQTHSFRLRVNPKLVSLVLSFVMVGSLTGCKISNNDKANDKNTSIEDTNLDINIELIENILKEHPNMLESRSIENYTVEFGDTLSDIAAAHGTTIDKLLQLNGYKSDREIIYPGTEIKVENVQKFNDIDSEIAILESYIHDYVLNTIPAKIARGEVEATSEQKGYYASIFYGDSNGQLSGVESQFIRAYDAFHNGSVQNGDEQKNQYISILSGICESVEARLNLNGMTEAITPYAQYKIYCKNGNTLTTDLQEEYKTVYD